MSLESSPRRWVLHFTAGVIYCLSSPSGCSTAATGAPAAIRSSRSPGSTGASSTWLWCSSSRFSTCGDGAIRGDYDASAQRPATAPDPAVPADLGTALRTRCAVVHGRLHPRPGSAALGLILLFTMLKAELI